MEGTENTTPVENTEMPEAAEATEAPAVEAEAVQEVIKELFNVKINGEDAEVDMDELLRGYQTGKASHMKFQEASDNAKKAEAIWAKLGDNPMEALAEQGHDPLKFAESIIDNHLRQLDMSEEEIATENAKSAMEKELESLRAEKESYEADKLSRAQAEQSEYYDKVITGEMDRLGLPNDTKIVSRMAEMIHANLANGFELPIEHIGDMVKEEYVENISRILGNANPEFISKALGAEGSKKLQKWNLSKAKKAEKVEVPKVEAKPASKSKKNQTINDFFNDLRG